MRVYAAGHRVRDRPITMVGNTGTYLDSPFHRYADGDDLAGLPLERLVGLPAVVVAPERRAATRHHRRRPRRPAGARLRRAAAHRLGPALRHSRLRRRRAVPHRGRTASLIDQGVVLVGIDSVNIDDTESGGARPAHTLLLGAGMLVVEHLTALDRLPTLGCRFTAAPPRVRGFGTFPVRAFAELPVDEDCRPPAARPACAPRTRRSAPGGRARRACAPGRDHQGRS